MIYLTNYQQFAPSKDWLRKADEVTRKLQCMEDDEERTRYINKRARLWSELKERLFELSHGKCWYCEAKEERSDYHVDHFRPKNRIHDDNGVRHDGYWWLAFDWRNYRLACSYCNSPHKGTDGKSRGKSDLFPIKDETWRATGPDCDVDDEMPLLLDPTIQGEPELLWFMEDGKAYPAAETNT